MNEHDLFKSIFIVGEQTIMLRHGFSFFHWSLIEQILIDEVDINDLDDNVFE